MAVLSSTNADYLSQTTGPDTLPDNTADWTIFCWVQDVSPAVSTGYKVGFVLFVADGDYTQPYVTLLFNQAGGFQTMAVQGYNSVLNFSTPAVIVPLDTYQAVACTYDHTTHAVHLLAYVFDPIAGQTFVDQGTFTIDLSSTTFTAMRALNDASGTTNQPGVAMAMYRQWAAKLDIAALNAETQDASAVRAADLVTQTPLMTADDLTDLTSNHNNWTAVGSPTTRLPGPLAKTACQFVVIPEQETTFFCDTQGNVLQQAPPQGGAQASPIVTACPTRAGTIWAAADDAGTGFSALYELDPVTGATLRTIPVGVRIGDLAGSHSLFELPTGDLVTVNRATHDLIRIAIPAGTVAQSYAITMNPLDAAINSDGSRLVYVDGPDVKAYDLTNATDLGTLFTPPNPVIWPVWLGDCSILASEATYLQDGDLVRFSQAGAVLFRYVYDHGIFDEGQVGLAADIGANRIWLVGDWDRGTATEQAATLLFTLSPGGPIEVVPLPASTEDFDVASAVTAVYLPIGCTPMPPSPTTTVYPVRRLRRFMLPFSGNLYTFLSRLEIYIQAGIGTIAVPDPQVMIRLSRDGGFTWGPLLTGSAGRIGEFSHRVYWNRLGRGRNWVVELTVSDPVMWSLLEAFADIEEGTS